MVRIAARSFLDLIKHDSIRVVFYFGAISFVGRVQSHTFRQERESDQSQRLEAFRCGPQMVVVNSVKQRKVNFGWQPAVWKQPGGGTKESLPLSQTAGTSMLENNFLGMMNIWGLFFQIC